MHITDISIPHVLGGGVTGSTPGQLTALRYYSADQCSGTTHAMKSQTEVRIPAYVNNNKENNTQL